MKKISLLITSIIVVLMVSSCDKLDAPYYVKTLKIKGDTIPLTPDDTNYFDGKKVLLLEDFTGVKCPNCPNASMEASNLLIQHEGHLIVLSVHPFDVLQHPGGGFPDFRTQDGTKWKEFFNVGSYPCGTVNGEKLIEYTQWSSSVAEAQGDADIRMIIKTEYNDAKRELNVTTHSKFLKGVDEKLNLTTCFMEDSIIGMQKLPNGSIDSFYMHRHVFRGTADGLTWGGAISDNSGEIEGDVIEEGRNFIRTMKFTVDSTFNADQLYIVSFISREDDHVIIQAAEKKIK